MRLFRRAQPTPASAPSDLHAELSAAQARSHAIQHTNRHARLVYSLADYQGFLHEMARQFRRLLDADETVEVPMRINILDPDAGQVHAAHSWGNGFHWETAPWHERLAEIVRDRHPAVVVFGPDAEQLAAYTIIDVPWGAVGTLSVALEQPSPAVIDGAVNILGRFAEQLQQATLAMPTVAAAVAGALRGEIEREAAHDAA